VKYRKFTKANIKIIKKKIETLKSFSPFLPNIKALKGELKGRYRLRVGDYRVVFRVVKDQLLVIIVEVFPRGSGY
jgi:mRNA interferase RelE/StbE